MDYVVVGKSRSRGGTLGRFCVERREDAGHLLAILLRSRGEELQLFSHGNLVLHLLSIGRGYVRGRMSVDRLAG